MADNAQTTAGDDVLKVDVDGQFAILTLNRPEKRNAINDTLVSALDAFFSSPPEGIRVVIIKGAGGNFSAGLDLSEHVARKAMEVFPHSRNWHRIMEMIQFGGLPVVAVMTGATMGGGLEIATSCHVRIAEPSVRFQLPEGRRGIFVGGGGSVRVGRILGADRMTEMMLTGRSYYIDDAVPLGLAHYRVEEGEGMKKALELAESMAGNAQLSNHFIIQALSRIDDMSRADGLFAESLTAALLNSTDDAIEGLNAFLQKRKAEFK